MTRDQILSMPAGRELDALVVVHVMEYEKMQTIFFDELDKAKTYYCVVGSPESEEVNVVEYRDGRWLQYSFNPSTDISAAWEVWTHEVPKNWYMELTFSDGMCTAKIKEEENDFPMYKTIGYATSESAAEAMVKCRLLAVMGL